jgi:glycosyltransferase involved in cell wall biosynthesis
MSSAIIVVPCYNEAKRLDVGKFEAFLKQGHNVRFLFVNDGSTDHTSQVLETLCRSHPDRFDVYHLPRNMGKAEAVRLGLLKAFESCPDYAGFWDADLATPLDTIPSFCDLLDRKPGIEIVFGSRVQLLGRSIERKMMRHYVGRAFATMVALILNLKVYDTQCGAKLFKRSDGVIALFQEIFVTRWLMDVEIIARLIQIRRGTDLPPAEAVIYEVPLSEWRDVRGSKLKYSDFLKAMFEMVSIRRRYVKRKARVL